MKGFFRCDDVIFADTGGVGSSGNGEAARGTG
jgi:hypothetical protein